MAKDQPIHMVFYSCERQVYTVFEKKEALKDGEKNLNNEEELKSKAFFFTVALKKKNSD